LVRKAVQLSKDGAKASQIEEKILNLAKRNRTYFLVDTLEYLQKGGRIGAAKALVSSLLQMKPILGIKDGQVEAIETQRTKKKRWKDLSKLL